MILRRLLLSSVFSIAAIAPGVASAQATDGPITVTLGAAGQQTPSQAPATFIDFESATPADVTISGLNVVGANQFGGAGGVGSYAATGGTGTLTFTAAPTTYFGAWISALDGASGIEFFDGGTLLGGFNLRDAFGASGGGPAYFGNPNATFLGQNAGEAYAYFNFNSTSAFDRVNLYGSCCNGTGTIEVDNIAVGLAAAGVPEPSTWALMIAGFGMVGGALRRRRVSVSFA